MGEPSKKNMIWAIGGSQQKNGHTFALNRQLLQGPNRREENRAWFSTEHGPWASFQKNMIWVIGGSQNLLGIILPQIISA